MGCPYRHHRFSVECTVSLIIIRSLGGVRGGVRGWGIQVGRAQYVPLPGEGVITGVQAGNDMPIQGSLYSLLPLPLCPRQGEGTCMNSDILIETIMILFW